MFRSCSCGYVCYDGKVKMNELLRKCQLANTEVLKRFIEVCKKHNLKYYAYCGTLLGAVRHGGFIPWDDDIDVAMFRYDFNKFMDIAPAELPDLYVEYYDSYTPEDKRYFDFTGVARINTRYQPDYTKDFPYNAGIDIFPLDYLPWNYPKKLIEKGFLLMSAYAYRHKTREGYPDFGFNAEPIKDADRLCAKPFTWHTCDKVSDLFNLIAGHTNMIFDTKYFDHTVKLPFENIEIECPKGLHHILKQQYGEDYMIPKKYFCHNVPEWYREGE